MTESRHFHCIALSRVGEVSVLGILKAKGLALILALMPCPCLYATRRANCTRLKIYSPSAPWPKE